METKCNNGWQNKWRVRGWTQKSIEILEGEPHEGHKYMGQHFLKEPQGEESKKEKPIAKLATYFHPHHHGNYNF